ADVVQALLAAAVQRPPGQLAAGHAEPLRVDVGERHHAGAERGQAVEQGLELLGGGQRAAGGTIATHDRDGLALGVVHDPTAVTYEMPTSAKASRAAAWLPAAARRRARSRSALRAALLAGSGGVMGTLCPFRALLSNYFGHELPIKR